MKFQPLHTADAYIKQVLQHIGLGILIFLIAPLSNLYFVVALVYFLVRILMAPKSEKVEAILLGCAYFVGAEVFFRMTDGGLAYEASKYLVILFMLMGMFFKGLSGKGYPYFFYLIALVPAVLVASITLSWGANFRTNIAFVLSGPVALGIAALFCYDRKVRQALLYKIINYIALPAITTTTYLFLYNPSIKETLSGTSSNSAASGGFGPNQVATILGLGMFALVVRLFLKSPSLGLKLFNLVLLGGMTFRAIVTFSRGGIFAAIIVVIAFLGVLFFKVSAKQKNQIMSSLALFVIGIVITWTISSNQTRGLIDKRYANENAQGVEKSDITTGRLELFMEEMMGFINHPFLGEGASRTKDIRVVEDGRELPSHNEIGRLLSEHGIFGIFALLILIIKPLSYRAGNRRNVFFYAFFCFWFATINHSGTRIAAPAFLYALCLLNIQYERPVVHRKLLKK